MRDRRVSQSEKEAERERLFFLGSPLTAAWMDWQTASQHTAVSQSQVPWHYLFIRNQRLQTYKLTILKLCNQPHNS